MMQFTTFFIMIGVFLGSVPFSVSSQDYVLFHDLPPSHPAWKAIQNLVKRDILSGYEDGSFRPEKHVNRAEALKMILSPLLSKDTRTLLGDTPFIDVPQGEWYVPFVEVARVQGVIDGPPLKTRFEGERNVLKVEFLKILFLAHKIEDQNDEKFSSPLSLDTHPSEWYHSYMVSALKRGMAVADSKGLLYPSRALTRSDAALILDTFFSYRNGSLTQGLLNLAEREMIYTLRRIEDGQPKMAQRHAVLALILSRGALDAEPTSTLTQAASSLAQAFHSLSKSFAAGKESLLKDTIEYAQEAWGFADEAMTFDENLRHLSLQVQNIAHSLAESARP